jgi:uncharacterized membrane protein HdeD (DUF308 family)
LTSTEKSSNNDSNNKRNDKRPPKWLRFLELGLGATAIILTIIALTYPGITTQTIIRIVSAVLLIIGFERIAVGIALPSQNKSMRLANIGLGPLIIAIAIIVIAFPLSPARPPIALGALALLFNGINKIVQGARVKEIPGWSRSILLGVGVLNIFVSALAMIAPSDGEHTLARSISITLLITGIQMIISTIGIKKKYSKSKVSV